MAWGDVQARVTLLVLLGNGLHTGWQLLTPAVSGWVEHGCEALVDQTVICRVVSIFMNDLKSLILPCLYVTTDFRIGLFP